MTQRQTDGAVPAGTGTPGSTRERRAAPGRAARPGPAGAPRWRGLPLRDDRWPDWLATVCFVIGLVSLVAAFVPVLRRYFVQREDLVSALTFPIVPNVTYVAVVVGLGIGLRRRLRPAWWAFLILMVVLPGLARAGFVVAGIQAWVNGVGLAISIGLFAALVGSRHFFPAKPSRAAGWKASGFFVAGLAAYLTVGYLLLTRFSGSSSADFTTGLLDTVLADLGLARDHDFAGPLAVRGLINLLGAAVVLGSTFILLRTPTRHRTPSALDEARVRGMLREFGDADSLGYFATRRDKAVIYDTADPQQATAGISYRVVSGVSLASGDPLGDPQRWPEAIAAWRADAREFGWSLAVMAPGQAGARAYTEAGLVAYEIGDEAILDLGTFSLNRPGMKPVRVAVARLRRRGYQAVVRRHADLSPQDFERLADAASRWRGDGGDERGFSMALGRLGDPLDGDCVLVEAIDGVGNLRGFLSLVPWGRTGLSLDLMRRDPTADNGLIEYLVTSLAEQAPRLQVGRVSLNFAMFREAFERGEEIGAGPLARLGRQALLLASRSWQLESLYRSNAKYLPEWQPRYICFEYASDLPRVGIATGSAEGFLARPTIRGFLHRGEGGETLTHEGEEYARQVRAAIPPAPDRLAIALSATRHSDQERVRRAKLDAYREAGIDPYPVGHPRTHALSELTAQWAGTAPDTHTGQVVSVVGRVLRKRDHGGLCFLTIRDGSGDLQVMASRQALGEQTHRWFRGLDLGDHVGVSGEVVTTRTGALTVDATSFALTSKSLHPLPDKRLGLTDAEARVRMRYVDLIVRPEARSMAYLRSTVVRSIRDSLHSRGYTEVETPILQLVHGGANARPFETHINAYDLDLSLRIATELHLKRLVVGGMEQVFELGRQFRNEGADSSHNPEFTSLEVYGTYRDYVDMRRLTQSLIQEAAVAVFGEPVARRMQPDGSVREVDLSGDWPAIPICEAVSQALGEEVTPDTPHAELLAHARRIGLDLDPSLLWGAVLEEVYGELCESTTTLPVFYTDFPRDTSPLTRVHRSDPRLVEKWDLVMWASEQGTAYSELIDPVDQRARLVEQSLLAAAGDLEAMEVDEDFLQALEYGMPPTGGMGLGVDRLVMNLTGLGIRDTILFPLVKPT